MTVKRTGQGPILPPRAAEGKSRADQGAPEASTGKAGEVVDPATLPGIDALPGDSFEDEARDPERITGSGKTRIEDLAWPSARPSQVKSMERLFAKTAVRVRAELAKAEGVVAALRAEVASSGDVAAALAERGDELLGARTQVARHRRRLLGLHRRLALSGRTRGGAPPGDASMRRASEVLFKHEQLREVGERLERTKPGVERALAALTALSAVSGHDLRVDVTSRGGRAELGSVLAHLAPGLLLAAHGQAVAGDDEALASMTAAAQRADALPADAMPATDGEASAAILAARALARASRVA